MEQRLQKILSQGGVCSRRKAETLLEQGRVLVNGTPACPGDKADWDRDAITVDGVPVTRPNTSTCLMLYKPRGYVTTLSDERGRPNVAALASGCGARVWPVGRLDLDSEGLLLLTDDGDLTYRLTHPKHQVEKEYFTWVVGDAAAALPVLSEKMYLDGQPVGPARVKILRREEKTSLLSVVIHEGKNRQVRRMCDQAGLRVVRLKRVREGNLRLDPALRPGQWRLLRPEELEMLTK